MKLSLNLPALERLIGGDSELEIELRTQVIKEFTKKHLSSIINTEVYAKYITELMKDLRLEIEKQVGKCRQSGYYDGFVQDEINEEVRNIIKNYLEASIKALWNEYVDKEVKQYINHVAPYIDQKVKEIFNTRIEWLIQDGIKERLQKVLNS